MRCLTTFAVFFCLIASGVPALAQTSIGGNYSVEGTNPNGTTYSGTAIIRQEGDRYSFSWVIKSGDTFKGTGVRDGDTIVVEWGQDYPVIYQIDSNGVLNGKWDNGQGTETLTPLR
jgi:hypothetical protein